MERFMLHNRNPQFLQHVMDSLADMTRVVNSRGETVWMNDRMRRILDGASPGDPEGGFEESPCARAMVKGRAHSVTRRYRGRTYKVTASPLCDWEGGAAFAIEVWRDVTGEMRMRDRIISQNRKLTQDLLFARRLQQALLPDRMPKANQYFFDALYHPCEAVGGDFYDLFSVGDDTLVFYIADVAGHGVTAAMLTVFFSQTVRSVLHVTRDAATDEVLREVSDRFSQMGLEEHLYITAWLGCLDIVTGRLRYSNAGHVAAPLLWDGNDVRPLELPGLPVCRWTEDARCRVGEAVLPPGGRLLLHTDGLSDAWRSSGAAEELAGYESARELARSCLMTQPEEIVLPSLWDQVSRGMDEQDMTDDVAMLLIAREPAADSAFARPNPDG
ncbi:MAG: SpoIIE family protein phosphatase [Clostridiales bacterium]|nr:SpoIIE family protein phosphatase [Clostridiales bacterium]